MDPHHPDHEVRPVDSQGECGETQAANLLLELLVPRSNLLQIPRIQLQLALQRADFHRVIPSLLLLFIHAGIRRTLHADDELEHGLCLGSGGGFLRTGKVN